MLSIDIAIVLAYLLFTLYIGIKYGRGTNSIEMFATGGRNFTTATLAATIAATSISGSSFIIGVQYGYQDGLLDFLATSGNVIAMLTIGYIFVPRMKEFLGKLSVADVMGELYGDNVRIITAITGFIVSIGMIALQVKILGSTLAYFSGVSTNLAVMISMSVLIIYSASGGVRAVVFTDFMQFFTFLVVIPVITLSIFYAIDFNNNPESASKAINHAFEFVAHSKTDYLTLFLFALIPGLSPGSFQRILIGKSTRQVQNAFKIASGIYLIYIFIVAMTGIMLFTYDSNIEISNLFGYMLDNFSYTGFRGLAFIAIMAMAMSTADSHLNSFSVMFSHDFLKPLGFIRKKETELKVSRISLLVVGVSSTMMAIYFKDLLQLLLFTKNFYVPVVTVPLMLAILGFRSSTKSVLTGMSAGFAAVVIWKTCQKFIPGFFTLDSMIPAMLTNLLFFIGSHYYLNQPGGWVGPKETAHIEHNARQRQENFSYLKDKFRDLFYAFLSPKTSLLKINESQVGYFLLGVIMMATFFSVNVTMQGLSGEYFLSFSGISTLVISAILILKPLWESSVRKEINYSFILFSLCYLIFISSFMMFSNGFSNITIISLFVNMLVIIFYLDFISAVILNIVSLIIGYLSYTTIYGPVEYSVDYNGWAVISYMIFVICVILLPFLRGQQNQIANLENDKEALNKLNEVLNSKVEERERNLKKALDIHSDILRNINHEIKTPMSTLMSNADLLKETWKDPKLHAYMDHLIEGVSSSVVRFSGYASNLIDLSAYQTNKMLFDIKPGNLRKLLEKITSESDNIFLNYPKDVTTEVDFDEVKLNQLFKYIIDNALKYGEGSDIEINVSNDSDIRFDGKDYKAIKIVVKDSGLGIPLEEMEKIFEPFSLSSRTFDGSGGRGLGLALSREIVTHHRGFITASNNPDKGASIHIILPVTQPNGKFLSGEISPQEEVIDLRQIIIDVKKIDEKHNNKTPKILMVDDDKHVLGAGSMIIKSLGYEFIGIATGAEAEEFINSDEFDASLILLDMMLGDTNGLEVMRKVGERLSALGVPVIVQSGLPSSDPNIVATLKLGAKEFMGKPYKRSQVADVIKKYLG